ncbi:hypothetical protein K7X08_019535 [Anisodus acutangulus]|uniref:Uncharacterized protein n=1 Tax=Anisodus acutangulus TaxID=402998 RepID=A0A9Q1RPK4_9SOLA|nr:hypothetical protein K7X08_019535 [Anisodus acutangulus]
MCLIFEKSGVASSLFDEMLDNSGEYPYNLISQNVDAQHMLLHFPFDPGSAAGRMFDSVALAFDNNLQLNFLCMALMSTIEFAETPMVFIASQVFNTMSHRFYCSKFLGDTFWLMIPVRPRLGSLVAIDFSVKYVEVVYTLVLIDASVSLNGKPDVVVIVIGRDIADLCYIGLDSRDDQNVLILECHYVAVGAIHCFDIDRYKFDYGTSLFSGFYSRGPPATLLAHVLDVLVGSIPCMNYHSWVVYAPKGEFLSSVDPAESFKFQVLGESVNWGMRERCVSNDIQLIDVAVLGDGIANFSAKLVCVPVLAILVQYIDKNDLVLSPKLDEQVLPVASPESYISNMLTFSLVKFDPYTDAEDEAQESLMILSNDAPCHVYQYECHFKDAVHFIENYTRTWNLFLSFMYTFNWCHVALSYLEKTWVQFPCLLTDAILWIS